jgi:uncharacterized SAM-binding protein YcdF (DUF218 family)
MGVFRILFAIAILVVILMLWIWLMLYRTSENHYPDIKDL